MNSINYSIFVFRNHVVWLCPDRMTNKSIRCDLDRSQERIHTTLYNTGTHLIHYFGRRYGSDRTCVKAILVADVETTFAFVSDV